MMEKTETREDLWQRARRRVEGNADLQPWFHVLLDYDWPNMDEHLEWVCSADRQEIIDWAETVSRDW